MMSRQNKKYLLVESFEPHLFGFYIKVEPPGVWAPYKVLVTDSHYRKKKKKNSS